jgi:hypothetical protein
MDWTTLHTQLSAPFSAAEIGWRVARSGFTADGQPWAQILAYIGARMVMDRLDATVGPGHWQTELVALTSGGFIARLGLLRDMTSEWVWREDAAPLTDVEAVKGGASDALKRVAVQFGIGRYLYRLPDTWAVFTEDKSARYRDKIKRSKEDRDGVWLRWNPPPLPAWALPD